MKWLLVILLAVLVVGCEVTKNPDTGEKQYRLTPKVDENIEKGGAAVEAIGPAAVAATTMISPLAGGVVGIVFGILTSTLTLYRQWKKPLNAKSDAYDKVVLGLRASGDVIEKLVKPTVELWIKAKPDLKLAEASGATMPDKI